MEIQGSGENSATESTTESTVQSHADALEEK